MSESNTHSWDEAYDREQATYEDTGDMDESSEVWFSMRSVNIAVTWITKVQPGAEQPNVPHNARFVCWACCKDRLFAVLNARSLDVLRYS